MGKIASNPSPENPWFQGMAAVLARAKSGLGRLGLEPVGTDVSGHNHSFEIHACWETHLVVHLHVHIHVSVPTFVIMLVLVVRVAVIFPMIPGAVHSTDDDVIAVFCHFHGHLVEVVAIAPLPGDDLCLVP